MCKVLMFSGITNATRKNALAFMKEMADPMSTGNRDGLGYTAVDGAGSMFGERWLENKDAFADETKQSVFSLPEVFTGALVPEGNYTSVTKGPYGTFGVADGETIKEKMAGMVAVTMHTRYATSAKGFQNVHPFVDAEMDTSLIHNGVIRNEADFKFTLSTCDSEAVLISYLENNVNLMSSNVKAMADKLVGYYACGVFSRDLEGNRILDIFKGNNASLSALYVKELNTLVFTTSTMDVESVCKKLGFEVVSKFNVKDGFLLRFNPITGEAYAKETFTVGKEYNYNNYNYSNGYHDSGKSKGSTGARGNTTTVTSLPSRRFQKKESLTSEQISFLSLAPSVQELDSEEVASFLVTNHVVGE